MEAGCPYLICPKDALASPITLEHVQITRDDPWEYGQGYCYIKGTFQKTDEVPAFSAYIIDDPNGIKMIDNGQQTTDNDAKWYDLQGREMRNNKFQKGIYVTKGKAVRK